MQNNIIQMFSQFMNQYRGQNPSEMLNSMITSGKISQQQLNQAQAMANQISGQLEQYRGMFGF